MSNTPTPAAHWRENGEADPHGTEYNCERSALTLGDLTDDELANAVYLHGDTTPPMEDLLSGKAKMPIVYLTAAKERIRWLSRRLSEATTQPCRSPYCECEPGQCTHPGFHDARGEAIPQRVITCVYCGHHYPAGTPSSGADSAALTEHIKVCEKHPMRQLEADKAALLDAIAEADDCREILGNLIDNIKSHGHYSVEATLVFLDQARSSLNPLQCAVETTRSN